MTTAVAQPRKQTEAFSMHPKLLYDVICRQAGSLDKAILELVMNSLDARATECTIEVSRKHVQVFDNGKGIQTMSDIRKYFKTFGQPHEESEQKIYGTFRMGRGQAFAFGRNLWKTGRFELDVDIRERGVEFDLLSRPRQEGSAVKGCQVRIDLYDELSEYEYQHTLDAIRKQCCYVNPKVHLTLNDVRVNSTEQDYPKFAVETDEYRLAVGEEFSEMRVYNQGIYVRSYPSTFYGLSGLLLSTAPLKLNFARNDIMSDCPVFSKAKAELKKRAETQVFKKKRLSGVEASTAWRNILNGVWAKWELIEPLRIVPLASGEVVSLGQFQKLVAQRRNICVYEGQAILRWVADQLDQQHIAVVLASKSKSWSGGNRPTQLMTQLSSRFSAQFGTPEVDYHAYDHAPGLDQLSKKLSKEFTAIPRKQATAAEETWLQLAEDALRIFRWRSPTGSVLRSNPPRAIRLGEAARAAAWTDGTASITFSRQFLSRLTQDISSCVRLVAVLAHELSHDSDSLGEDATHHGPEFYRIFHDLTQDGGFDLVVDETVKQMFKRMQKSAGVPKKELSVSRPVLAEWLSKLATE